MLSEYFRTWLLWCWLDRDAEWSSVMGPTTFEEYVAILAGMTWDLFPPA